MAPHTRSSMGVGVAKNVNRKTTVSSHSTSLLGATFAQPTQRNTNRSLVSSQHDLMSQVCHRQTTFKQPR